MTKFGSNGYIWAGTMLWVAAACGGSLRPPGVTPSQMVAASSEAPDERGMDVKTAPSGAPSEILSNTSSGAASAASSEAPDERGMDVKIAPSDAPSETSSNTPPGDVSDAPFVLETRLRARRTQNGRPITFDEVRSGDSVMDGDRLQLSVRTSEDAYLYLAFCSQHARDPRYHGFSVFPEKGGIRTNANETTMAPTRTSEIVLDDKPGQETLYLILSRAELSHSDSGLADVIAAARQGRQTVDCGAPLRSAMAGPHKKNTVRRSWSGGRRGSAASKPQPVLGPAKQAARAANTEAGKPVVEIEREGDIAANGGVQSGVQADPDGIVILRYELKHVPAPPGSSQSGAPASP